jgi:hypothetical protein
MMDTSAGPQTEADLLSILPRSNRPGVFPRDLLSPGERVLFETRPSLAGLYWGRLTVLILLELLFVDVTIGLPTNPLGGFFCALFALVIAYYVLKWRSTAYALTHRRVLSVSGLRQPTLLDALFDQVRNLRLEPGFSGGIKFDATPPDAPTTFLGGRKYAKTIYWKALPLASRTYEFVQQAFAILAAQGSRDALRADLVARIAENKIPCDYCGTLIDVGSLDPLHPKCPSCGAPFVPVEVLRAAVQARVEPPGSPAPSPMPVVPVAPAPFVFPSPGPVRAPFRPTAAPPSEVRPPAPPSAAARPAVPPSAQVRPAGSPAAPSNPADREPAHRRRNRRAMGSPRSAGLLVVMAVLVSTAGLAGGSFTGPVLRAGARPATGLSTSGVSPPPTAGAVAAFDVADGYVLMFGGVDAAGAVVPWTWSFVHNNWTNLTSAIGAGPSARWGEGLAYDPSAHYLVLFGGCLDVSCTSVSNDTWVYAQDRWTNLSTHQSTTPPARGRTMMTYDTHDSYVLLFGGDGLGGAYLNDEWAFAGGHWAAVGNLSSPRPAARAGGMMADDPATSSTILFGGFSASGSLGDTWSYQNGNWTNLTSATVPQPSPRRLAMIAYDGADGYLMLVNGYNTTYLGDEWSFAQGSWARLVHRGGPVPTFGGILVYDPVDRYVLYFSGFDAEGILTSTLVYSNGNWTLLINPTYSSLTPLGVALVTLAVVAVIVGIAWAVGNRLRRKQERLLGEGFVLPPGETPTWVPTGPAFRSRYVQQVLPMAILLAVLVPFLAISFSTGGLAAALLLAVVLVPMFAVLIAFMTWVVIGQTVRAIGIVRSGVILSRRLGELRVPWSQLQPGVLPPRRGWFWFRYIMPGKSVAIRGFSTTMDQAKAILSSRFAPPWVLTPAVATALGLPPRAPGLWSVVPPVPGVAAPLFPDPVPAPEFPPPPLAAPPLVAASPEPYGTPLYPPPTVQPPPPDRYPPAAAPPPYGGAPASPARPPPGMKACPNCGQLNRSGRVAFCTACGARLR